MSNWSSYMSSSRAGFSGGGASRGTKKGLLIAAGVLFAVGVVLLVVLLAVKTPAPSIEVTLPAAGVARRSGAPLRARASIEVDSEADARAALAGDTPSIVFLYADWCGHCKRMAPIYDMLAQSPEYAGINMLKLSHTKATALAKEKGIKGFPTFLTNWGEGKYVGAMPEPKMKSVLDLAKGGRGRAARGGASRVATQQGARVASVQEAQAALTGPTPSVVFISTDSCGFCKKMQPVWEQAAQSGRFNHIKMVQIDAKDAGALTKAHGVTGFPTMLSNRGDKKYVGYRPKEKFEEMLMVIGKN